MTEATTMIATISIMAVVLVVVPLCFRFAVEKGLAPGFLVEFGALGFRVRINLKTK
jgi:hypothetical protein